MTALHALVYAYRDALLAWGKDKPLPVQSRCKIIAQNLTALGKDENNAPVWAIIVKNIEGLKEAARQNGAAV